jgi:nucleoside-diphosphate-sugar epimerase
MSKNLVTGGSGFLGGHLVEALVAHKDKVRVLVRPTSKIAHLKKLNVELVYGDLYNSPSLERALQGIESLYHCAAIASDWGTRESFYQTNVTGIHNLLEASLKAGVKKFIHISTTDVYGYPDYPADEKTPYRSRGWPYVDSKIEGEQLVWAYYKKHHLPITIIRPVNIYGPRSVTFVSDIADLLKNNSMVYIGNSNKPAGLAYVTNVVDAILRAAKSKKSIGQAYNVSDGSNVTWKQYVIRLAQIVGTANPKIVIPYRLAYSFGWSMEKLYGVFSIKSRPLLTRMAAELFGTNQGFPIDKARQELGYEPEVNFNEGMNRVENWLHEKEG